MKLKAKYLPYVNPDDECGVILAPTVFHDRELAPMLFELETPDMWAFAYRWAADEVEGMDDFIVLMEICGCLAWRESLHVGRAESFVRRLADPVRRRPEYVEFARRVVPNEPIAEQPSWRALGGWVLYALREPPANAATKGPLVPGLEYPTAEMIEQEINRRSALAESADDFIVVLELLAVALCQVGSFVQNRTLRSYVGSLASAVILSRPRDDRPLRQYPELAWRHLTLMFGMATVLD